MNWRIFFILILGINGCEYLDEEPPEIIEGLACYFSMKNNTPAVRLSWIPTEDDDVTEYQIFKSSDNTGFIIEIFPSKQAAGSNLDVLKAMQSLKEQAMAKVSVLEGTR